MSNERRRSTRVEILGRLHGLVVSLDVPVTVTDLSLGGMAIETPVAFAVGAVQEFQLTMGDGSPVVLLGRVIRSENSTPAGAPPVYATGIQFIDEESPDASQVGDIIDKLS